VAEDSLKKQLEEFEAKGAFYTTLPDANIRPAVILLTKAVLRLDATSTRLWKVNIGLTAVAVVLAILQIFHH
jgi:hypothetical protein